MPQPGSNANGRDGSPSPTPTRVIKRYANRKLYDTTTRSFTSFAGIEALVRAGVDIQVVDHDSGNDLTGEILVGILGNALGQQAISDGVSLLTALIRAPGDVIRAVTHDEQQAEELRSMRYRVRLLSATIDAVLDQVEENPVAAPPPEPLPKKPKRTPR